MEIPYISFIYIISQTTCIQLQDIAHSYSQPCIFDIKIGQRLYDDDASFEKQERMKKQAMETTTGTLGLRICGLKVRHIPHM
jgi:1D-myo-inositol-tetrakisphosphate 5-kinase/inositol-polyphosphate multikinase